MTPSAAIRAATGRRGLAEAISATAGRLSARAHAAGDARARDLAEQARLGTLPADALEGGTFTLSNMGMLGVESFIAIITPPQAAVLATGTGWIASYRILGLRPLEVLREE